MGCTCGDPVYVWGRCEQLSADATAVYANAVYTSDKQYAATATAIYPNAAAVYTSQQHAADADAVRDAATDDVYTTGADAVCDAADDVYATGTTAVCNATNDVYATGANAANGDYYYDNDERDECGRSDVTRF